MRTLISASERAIKQIKAAGGMIRTRKAIDSGIYQRTLLELIKQGKLELISRGIYRLTSHSRISDPDLVTVATRIPRGVICLTSALSFHKITTQIPREVSIALPRNFRTPRLKHPPISIHRFHGEAFSMGIEKHILDGVEIKIYSAEKTLADCFKFRNKLGMDIVLEAMKLYKSKKRFNMNAIIQYSKICRVEKIMRPYLELVA